MYKTPFYTTINFSDYEPDQLFYHWEKGEGFLCDFPCVGDERLLFPELNSGFTPQPWLDPKALFSVATAPFGVFVSGQSEANALIPLIFKLHLPVEKAKFNAFDLEVTISTTNSNACNILLFANARKLIGSLDRLESGTIHTFRSSILLNEIIPRTKEIPFEHFSLDLSLLGTNVAFTSLTVSTSPSTTHTLFIAGDSTVTDQGTVFPYNPGGSYCGWGQMLPYFIKHGLTVSNQAHSGLTTESFLVDGHFSVIEKYIRPGDFVMFQFAHNDQKLPHLNHLTGYRSNLINYIKKVKHYDATPIIVSPLGRNTWKGDSQYNDLLLDYANMCKTIATEYDALFIDLHDFSTTFIQANGVDQAQRYFFPKDYTHTNDFGGFLMASYIASALYKIPEFSPYIREDKLPKDPYTPIWVPPETIILEQPPKEYLTKQAVLQPVNFTDLSLLATDELKSFHTAISALASQGILRNEEAAFRPFAPITRIDCLDWLVRTIRFVPTNVYNDHFKDVIGHEWYAGLVEVVIQNSLCEDILPLTDTFSPDALVDHQTFVALCMRSYLCRKSAPTKIIAYPLPALNSVYESLLSLAVTLGMINTSFNPARSLTRADAALYLWKLDALLS